MRKVTWINKINWELITAILIVVMVLLIAVIIIFLSSLAIKNAEISPQEYLITDYITQKHPVLRSLFLTHMEDGCIKNWEFDEILEKYKELIHKEAIK